jgi:hypothetical protein
MPAYQYRQSTSKGRGFMNLFNSSLFIPACQAITVQCSVKAGSNYRGENNHYGAFNFYPIFILRFESKVSGVPPEADSGYAIAPIFPDPPAAEHLKPKLRNRNGVKS